MVRGIDLVEPSRLSDHYHYYYNLCFLNKAHGDHLLTVIDTTNRSSNAERLMEAGTGIIINDSTIHVLSVIPI